MFDRCGKLENVTLSSRLYEVPSQMFRDCTSLKRITIPGSVTAFRYGAFDGCEKLETMEILGPIYTVESDVFKGCSSLKEIKYKHKDKTFTSPEEFINARW